MDANGDRPSLSEFTGMRDASSTPVVFVVDDDPSVRESLELLISAAGGWTMRDAAEFGVRRVSVGGALARVAWGGLIRAAKELAEHGIFDGFANAAPHAELQQLFRQKPGL